MKLGITWEILNRRGYILEVEVEVGVIREWVTHQISSNTSTAVNT